MLNQIVIIYFQIYQELDIGVSKPSKDENKKFIKTFQNNLITTTSNTYYIRFTYKTDEDYSKGQLEKGPVATDYVEHKEFVNDYDKVMKCVFKKTVWGNALYSTGISVNAGAGGRTYLICWSTHSSTGNNTTSYIGMLRCGYSDNNYSLTEIVKSQGPTSALLVSFSVDDNGILQYRNSASAGASRVFIYQLT